MSGKTASENVSFHIFKAANHRRMPWKNGGGETAEIAVFPEGADLAEFGWRVSMATVASDGPFSTFAGIDRTLSILTGAGMALDIGDRPTVLLTPSSEPLAFPADVPTVARLTSGVITDLNVMTHRGEWTHRVEKRIFSGAHQLDAEGGTTLILALGNMRVDDATAAVELGRLDCAVIEGEVLVSSDMPMEAYLIRIVRA